MGGMSRWGRRIYLRFTIRDEGNHYVYMLIDPTTHLPFYIGEGCGNRVFDHVNNVLNNCECNEPKRDKIRDIISRCLTVEHVIVRHGMTQELAFEVEAALIDAFSYCLKDDKLTNLVAGHSHKQNVCGRVNCGLMSDIEISNQYSAQLIGELDDDVVVININRLYHSGMSTDEIYNATKGYWGIDVRRKDGIHVVLSEFQGLIVEVFKVADWKPIQVAYTKGSKKFEKGETRTRYYFDKGVIDPVIRDRYMGRRLPKMNKQSPIIYANTINDYLRKEQDKCKET